MLSSCPVLSYIGESYIGYLSWSVYGCTEWCVLERFGQVRFCRMNQPRRIWHKELTTSAKDQSCWLIILNWKRRRKYVDDFWSFSADLCCIFYHVNLPDSTKVKLLLYGFYSWVCICNERVFQWFDAFGTVLEMVSCLWKTELCSSQS